MASSNKNLLTDKLGKLKVREIKKWFVCDVAKIADRTDWDEHTISFLDDHVDELLLSQIHDQALNEGTVEQSLVDDLTTQVDQALKKYRSRSNSVLELSLKALVDKRSNRVIFTESDEDFVDILLSFLTMPMGTITRLARYRQPMVGMGCMNNLYESVENMQVWRLKTRACKTMLLYPRNGAAAQCKRLKLEISKDEAVRYFLCHSLYCPEYKLSHYRNAICGCGERMDREAFLVDKENSDTPNRGVFVKEMTRLIITDDLRLMPPSTEASLSLLSKIGATDGSTIKECNINVGVDEVVTLLKCSLISKTPLTKTLLKQNPKPELDKENFDQVSDYVVKSRMEEPGSNGKEKAHIKLIISKSKNLVCYAEASEDFVDLLFSFLTVPLGYILKQMHSNISKGCVNHLYDSIQELDASKFLKSNEHKAMLINPKLAPDFGYENNPLGIEEHKHPTYYKVDNSSIVCNSNLIPKSPFCSSRNIRSTLTVLDPKSSSNEATGGGFVIGPAMFTVTDDLIITPISSISGLSVLKKLNVAFGDTKVLEVSVGREKALHLLVASFVSKSALTIAFLGEQNSEFRE